MLRDARDVPDGSTVSTDVCIVGAGPAGIAVARDLIASGASVHLLESGGLRPDRRTQELALGENAGDPYWPLDRNRRRCVGGTTELWGGWCRPLDALDLERRAWVRESGWPLARSDLDDHYRRAAELCELDGGGYEVETWESRLGAPRLPLPPAHVETKIYLLSPPTRFGRRYLDELRAARNVTVATAANALELVLSDDGTSVATVRVGCLTGTRFEVAPRYLVLAAGGIENARLLLLSSAREPGGIGNRNDLVGRFFMEHPHFMAGRLVLGHRLSTKLYRPGRRAIARLFLPATVQEEEGLLHSNVMLVPSGPRWIPAAAGIRLQRLWRRPRAFRLVHTLEQAPDPGSRVELGSQLDALGQRRARLHWHTGELERRTFERGAELIGQAVARAGLGWFEPEPVGRDRPWPSLQGRLGHHMGTTRMHPDAKHGVVDADGRVHGVRNLFVTGGSVFPTAGAGTPTITILALSLRLAGHLVELLRRTGAP
jgi:choline dehydrogenase-like flavoprotein